MAEWTMSAALNRALWDALAEDARVLVFGEDVGVSGGVFRVTAGLQEEFGEQRVFDTPISEAAIAGAAVGLCFAGWRPVVEMQFDAFSYPALEQVIDHVAKMRMRTRGRVDVPITIRIPSFGGIKGKEHHGESPETYYAHTAGLKVVVPSTPLDAYRLLRHAIADPDPVVVLEPKARYWGKEEGELSADGEGIGVGRVLRGGDDVTLVAYGAMVARALEAASVLGEDGIGARVVDLRSLAPLDEELLRRSVAGDGEGGGRPRGPSHARDGRRGRRPRDGARVRLAGRTRRPRDGMGRPVPSSVAGGRLPPERRPDRRGGEGDGGVLMAERVFAMPDLGEGLEEGRVVEWLVHEGDEVALNQPLVEVETAKATVEIPSPFAGTSGHAPRRRGSRRRGRRSARHLRDRGRRPATGSAPCTGDGPRTAVQPLHRT